MMKVAKIEFWWTYMGRRRHTDRLYQVWHIWK